MRTLASILSICLCLIVAVTFPTDSDARGGGHGGGGKGHAGISHAFGGKHSTSSSGSSYKSKSSGSHSKSFYYSHSKSTKTVSKLSSSSKGHRLSKSGGYQHLKTSRNLTFDGTVKRDSSGKIARSESAKHDFLKMHGYSKVPAGYQVDHIVPLYAGGRDDPSNMQLISVAQHHAKTKSDYEKYGR